MTEAREGSRGAENAKRRRKKLAAELRANLLKRKARAKSGQGGEPVGIVDPVMDGVPPNGCGASAKD